MQTAERSLAAEALRSDSTVSRVATQSDSQRVNIYDERDFTLVVFDTAHAADSATPRVKAVLTTYARRTVAASALSHSRDTTSATTHTLSTATAVAHSAAQTAQTAKATKTGSKWWLYLVLVILCIAAFIVIIKQVKYE